MCVCWQPGILDETEAAHHSSSQTVSGTEGVCIISYVPGIQYRALARPLLKCILATILYMCQSPWQIDSLSVELDVYALDSYLYLQR